VIKVKWGPGYKFFSHENGLKFSKKNKYFFGNGHFSINHFLRGALSSAFLKNK